MRKAGFPTTEVARFVAAFYRAEAFAEAVAGKRNVFVCMPSTSGENAIPSSFGVRLVQDFGGRVIENVGRAMATMEAKRRRTFSSKLRDPTRFEARSPLNTEADESVVIIDDIFSSGDSLVALRRALGMNPPALMLAAGPALPIPEVEIDRAALRLAQVSPADYAEVRRYLGEHLRSGYLAMLAVLLKELDDSPDEGTRIVELLRGGGGDVQGDAGRAPPL